MQNIMDINNNVHYKEPGLRECKVAAREIEQEIEDKPFVNVANVKLTVWIEKWLELNKERLSPSTNALYKTYLKTITSLSLVS